MINSPRLFERRIILQISLILSVIASSSLVFAFDVPGYHYVKTCDTALARKTNKRNGESPFFVERIVLDGTEWPEGVKENFTLMEYNLLNMLSFEELKKRSEMDHTAISQTLATGKTFFSKPLHQLEGVKRVFDTYKPNASIVVEVGSLKTLHHYDDTYLSDRYQESVVQGNDTRGIQLGGLFDRRLPLVIEVHSHKNLVSDKTGKKVFSRDLPIYIIYGKSNLKEPLFILSSAHDKSQRPDPEDPTNGANKRTEQNDASGLILENYYKQFDLTPGFHGGDLNFELRLLGPKGEHLMNREVQRFLDIGMFNIFDIATEDSTPFELRGTQYFFTRRGRRTISQLDGMFANAIAAKMGIVKKALVVPSIDKNGKPMPPPSSYEEREERGSDHEPSVFVLDLTKIEAYRKLMRQLRTGRR